MRALAACLVAMALLSLSGAARAGASDDEVHQLLDAIYQSEYRHGKFKDALDKIEVAKVLCEGDLCSKKAKAQLFLAIGVMHARLGDTAKADEAFEKAVNEDPAIELRKDAATPELSAELDKVKRARDAGAPLGCRASNRGQRPPRGWGSGEAYHCYDEASRAEQKRSYRRCQDDARTALESEDTPLIHALLARCLEADNDWIEASSEWEETARRASAARQLHLAQRANYRADQLKRRIPVLVILPPDKKSEGLEVRLDGAPLPPDVLGQELPVNPGEHTVLATSKRGDLPLRFKRTVKLEAGANLPVTIDLVPYSPEVKCILEATTSDALAKCLSRPSAAANLAVRVTTELSGYHDTDHVDVVTPSISTNVEDVTGGWGIGAALLIDVVTAASVDIVATASPRWREVRWEPSLNAHKRWGDVDVGMFASLSDEPDYLSGDVGAKMAIDLRQKTVTPAISYDYSHDVNAKADTPWSVFSKQINRHALALDLGLVLDKATFGSLNFTSVFENGDTSKPYRHIPMFAPDIAGQVRPGETIDHVNLLRLPEAPLEQLPTDRDRFALAAQVAHRFASSTLRASERLYADTWGLKATTTDMRYMIDVLKQLRVWPHLRFHAQSAADFYQLAYAATENPDGTVAIPALRTGDRELGALIAATGGGGIRYDFGGRRSYGVSFNGDVVYTRFLRALYINDRWGYFGALTFEAEFE